MSESKHYVAIEITSKTVRLAIGFVLNETVYLLHALETPALGVVNGFVEEPEELKDAIRSLLRSAENTLKIPLGDLVVALPPIGLFCARNHCMTNTVAAEMTPLDIANAISLVKRIKLSEELQIVDVIPSAFILDSKERYDFIPLGKKADSFVMHASIYAMHQQLLKGYQEVFRLLNLSVARYVIAPYAAALYLAAEAVTPTSYYMLNIGSDISTLSHIHNKKEIIASECFRFGSDRIDQAIAEAFSLTLQEARELKECYGMDDDPAFQVYLRDTIRFSDLKRVIVATIQEFFEKVRKMIEQWSREEGRKLAVILTGGGSNLHGIHSYAEMLLQHEIVSHVPTTIGARNRSYLHCLGLLQYAEQYIQEEEVKEMNTEIRREEPDKKMKKMRYDVNHDL